MLNKANILMSGGGTGGHIFPAIAVANALKVRLPEANILFVGARGKMEMEKVPAAGFPIEGLWISGFQRRLDLQNLMFPLKVLRSLREAGKIIKRFQPDIAVGTGGYASGPLLYAAARRRIPSLILEQNSYPGMTNRLLGKRVNKICVGYEGMEAYFPAEKIIVTGSPVRKEILEMKATREEGRSAFELSGSAPVLLIIGGSQGARRINQAILDHLEKILEAGVNVLWQTGKYSFEKANKAVNEKGLEQRIKVTEFIQRMDLAYAAADLIVSRAGAIAIAEITEVRKPAIYVPLPSAAEDHQTKNAQTLVKGHAAVMVSEDELDKKLVRVIHDLIERESDRLVMVQNLKRFSHPDATNHIVEEVLKLIGK
ncbi:MAG: undecaprenyldiphospho-muramoylpentapeptide beta-N-acetylglucosaminyltransferase [bacterium]|jgi:UDP-N-acetylglucosamine--N-acetylmuramyl-(pentapeptide) pyrophosphoryl-undecaprenol N-acetylglucosamine transferase